MERLVFEDYELFVQDEIVIKYLEIKEKDKNTSISFIAKYNEARQLIAELIRFGYDVHSINLNESLDNGYDSEYAIALSNLFDNGDEIWCQPMLTENGYVKEEGEVIYIFDNCSSKVIGHCRSNEIYEVHVGEDDDESFYPDAKAGYIYDNCAKKNDENGYGFTVSRTKGDDYISLSIYSTSKLDKAQIQSLLQESGF